MVEINNQRKAFLDMLAWFEGIDNGRQKNQKSWLWRHCRRSYLLITPITSQTCHAKPKNSNQQAPDATSFFPGGMPTASSLAWKDFSPKNRDAVALQQIKERGALPMIDRGDIRQAIDRCSNIWASLPGVMYRFEHKADSLIAKFKEAAERSERLMYEQSQRDYLRSGYLHHRLPTAAVNHYRDNATTYKAQRDKNARELEAGERGNYRTCRCVSVMLLPMRHIRRS